MRKLFSSAILVIVVCSAHAQHVSVGFDKMNVAYIGVDNPMSIASDIYECDQLVVKEDGKVLEGKDCQYNLHPTEIGKIKVEIYGKRGQELVKIGDEEIRVRRIPDFAVSLAGSRHDGSISTSKLSMCYGPTCNTSDFPYQFTFAITSFTVTVTRPGSTEFLFQKNIAGAQFDQETHNVFDRLKNNDIVELSNIRAIGPGGARKLYNVTLTIRN